MTPLANVVGGVGGGSAGVGGVSRANSDGGHGSPHMTLDRNNNKSLHDDSESLDSATHRGSVGDVSGYGDSGSGGNDGDDNVGQEKGLLYVEDGQTPHQLLSRKEESLNLGNSALNNHQIHRGMEEGLIRDMHQIYGGRSDDPASNQHDQKLARETSEVHTIIGVTLIAGFLVMLAIDELAKTEVQAGDAVGSFIT